MSSFVAATVAASMYGARNQPSAALPSFARLAWERSLFMAAALIAVAGFFVLLWRRGGSTCPVAARSGVAVYAVALIFLLVAEISKLSHGGARWPLIVTYVVLACLAQAVIGATLVRTRLVPSWVGWTSIAWNVGGLAILLMVGDIYIPIFHHVMPLVIGVPLLWRG